MFLCSISGIGIILGLTGILNYGYMGQDFTSHRQLVLIFPWGYSYALTNPPGLYWFGSLVRNYLSAAHYLECIALAFLVFNASALWMVYGFIWKCIDRVPLRFGAAAMATLIPFRVIHATVLAADAFTLPIFALVAVYSLRILEKPKDVWAWTAVSAWLTIGMLFKYTFAGLLPAEALLMATALRKANGGNWQIRGCMVAFLALAFPSTTFLWQMHESAKVKGSVSDQQWLPPEAPSVMRWRDILLPQSSDLDLLHRAPDYFKDKLYGFRSYSYSGLLHVACFSDIMNCFQPPAKEVPHKWGERTQDPFPRQRTGISETLQTWAIRGSVPISILAVIGTILFSGMSLLAILTGRPVLPSSTLVLTTLSVGYYSTVFFSLHRLGDPYTAGFWLPRLVLPAVLAFFCLGFVFLDFVASRAIPSRLSADVVCWGYFGYSMAMCVLFVGFLC